MTSRVNQKREEPGAEIREVKEHYIVQGPANGKEDARQYSTKCKPGHDCERGVICYGLAFKRVPLVAIQMGVIGQRPIMWAS